MSEYFADVSWSTRAENVRLSATPYRYLVDVNPLDPNEPGSYPMTVEVGDWFIDYSGYPFLIEGVNGNTLMVYDINERGNGQTSAYGPYSNAIGYVYRPKNNGFLLTQAQLRKLDASAADVIQNIEKGIIWKFRGVRITKDGVSKNNITELELVNINVEEATGFGWQGGSKLVLTASGSGANSFEVTQNNHGFDNDFIYYNGTFWEKAVASSDLTCATHFAVKVDDNTFKAYSSGDIEVTFLDDTNSSLVNGEYYFLSQTTPGKVCRNIPTSGFIQSVMVKTISGVTISIHEPYEYVSTGSGGSSTFIGLTDTPSSYINSKFLYIQGNSVIFKDITIQDILNLETTLNDKASLTSSNVFLGNNTFSGQVVLNGVLEGVKTKILYIDPLTKTVSYGNVPSGGSGTPGGSNLQMQYNDNGVFNGSPLYYSNTTESFGMGVYPDETSYFSICPPVGFNYNDYPILKIQTGWGDVELSFGAYKTVLSPIENSHSKGLVLNSYNRDELSSNATSIILGSRGFILNGAVNHYNSYYLDKYETLAGNRAKFVYGIDEGAYVTGNKLFVNELSLYKYEGFILPAETQNLKQYLVDDTEFEHDYEIFVGFVGEERAVMVSADLQVNVFENGSLKYINTYKLVESKRDDSNNEVSQRIVAIPYRNEYTNIEIVTTRYIRYYKSYYTIGIKNNSSSNISVRALMVVNKVIDSTWLVL